MEPGSEPRQPGCRAWFLSPALLPSPKGKLLSICCAPSVSGDRIKPPCSRGRAQASQRLWGLLLPALLLSPHCLATHLAALASPGPVLPRGLCTCRSTYSAVPHMVHSLLSSPVWTCSDSLPHMLSGTQPSFISLLTPDVLRVLLTHAPPCFGLPPCYLSPGGVLSPPEGNTGLRGNQAGLSEAGQGSQSEKQKGNQLSWTGVGMFAGFPMWDT